MKKILKNSQAGFTLIEMLVTVLILGILAAASGAVYLGYAKDAKTAEGKAVIGSMWTALQACAQTQTSVACTTEGQYGRVGLTAGGVTADERWKVSGGSLKMDKDTSQLALTGVIDAKGQKDDNLDILVSMKYDVTKAPPGTLECTVPPAGSASPC